MRGNVNGAEVKSYHNVADTRLNNTKHEAKNKFDKMLNECLIKIDFSIQWNQQ